MVPRHAVEPRRFPVGFGLLDPVQARRDEVPPDDPWPIHRLAAQHHKARVGTCPDRDAVTRTKDKELSGLEHVTRDLDLTRHGVDRALLVGWIERDSRARLKRDVSVE